MRQSAVGAAIALAVLPFAIVLASPFATRAQDQGSIRFSRPVPARLGPGGYFQSCPVGHFQQEPPIHSWKILYRGQGTVDVGLTLAALGRADEPDGPAFKITVRDARGVQSKTVNKARDLGAIETLSLALTSGQIYDLNVERLGSLLSQNPVHHYRLGAADPRLEIGWRDPLRDQEPDTEWAFHTDAGERFELEVLVDPLGGPGQATHATVEVFRPDGTFVLSPTAFPRLPAQATGPVSSGETLIVRVAADAHFQLRKASGSDIGFYAMPCQSPVGQPATGAGGPPQPAARGSGRSAPSASDTPGPSRTPVAIGALVGALLLAGIAGGVWQWAIRRPLLLRRSASADGAPAVGKEIEQIAEAPDEALRRLTTREREVVALLARGLTNRQISERLVISQGTAKRHVENILDKLELQSRSQVAAWAAGHGLLKAPDHPATGAGNSRTQPPER